jgi:hypothetical protein
MDYELHESFNLGFLCVQKDFAIIVAPKVVEEIGCPDI